MNFISLICLYEYGKNEENENGIDLWVTIIQSNKNTVAVEYCKQAVLLKML